MSERMRDFLYWLGWQIRRPSIRWGRRAFFFWSGSWTRWKDRYYDEDGPCACHEFTFYFGPFGYEVRPVFVKPCKESEHDWQPIPDEGEGIYECSKCTSVAFDDEVPTAG